MDGSRDGRRSWGADARAQMAPLGVALLLSIVIFGTIAIVVFGGTALQQTEDRSQVQRAEHLLTLFDSRTAMVALGDSDTQRTELVGSGTYTVNDDSGRIRLVHEDFNGTNDETIYDEQMGELVYEVGDTEITYQGGGVWRKESSGRARLVTPPEFSYRQSTLTFPLIRITNEDSAAGPTRARVRASERAVPIYPNRSQDYSVTGEQYRNPLTNGTLVAYVESKYYEGWAEYFRTRTDAEVTEYPSNNTVKAKLVSIGDRGKFDMPAEGNGIRVAGLDGDGHSMENFSFVLSDDNGDNADLDNLEWAFYAENGQRQLEVNLKNDDETAGIAQTVYYSDDGGSTYHGWINRTAYEIQNESAVGTDVNDDGDKLDAFIRVDLTSDEHMTYAELNKTYLTYFDNPDALADPGVWDEHGDTVSWEDPPEEYNQGDEQTTYNVTAHYFELMGEEWQLKVYDKKSETVEESESYGRIEYPGADKYVAYTHVTRNDVEIEFE